MPDDYICTRNHQMLNVHLGNKYTRYALWKLYALCRIELCACGYKRGGAGPNNGAIWRPNSKYGKNLESYRDVTRAVLAAQNTYTDNYEGQ